MGLDITAYSNLIHIGRHIKDPECNEGEPCGLDDCCYQEDHIFACAYDSFPQSFRGIPTIGTMKSNGPHAFLLGGCYEETLKTVKHRFRAGSYGGYNAWRADLQHQFNPNRDPDMPFYELIWFSDCEGTIGPEACADLLADFQGHASRYQPQAHWWINSYADWTRAFDLGADGGLVDFH